MANMGVQFPSVSVASPFTLGKSTIHGQYIVETDLLADTSL